MFAIIEDIALGMTYLHGRKVLHCDLKSSNILVNRCYAFFTLRLIPVGVLSFVTSVFQELNINQVDFV